MRPLSAPEAPGGIPPRPGSEKALWGRWEPVLGETVGLGKLAKPVGKKPPSLPFLAALAGAERDAKPFPF